MPTFTLVNSADPSNKHPPVSLTHTYSNTNVIETPAGVAFHRLLLCQRLCLLYTDVDFNHYTVIKR